MNLADALAWAASPLLCSLKQLCPNVQLYEEAGCAYLRPGRRDNSGSIRCVTELSARHLGEADPQVHALRGHRVQRRRRGRPMGPGC